MKKTHAKARARKHPTRRPKPHPTPRPRAPSPCPCPCGSIQAPILVTSGARARVMGDWRRLANKTIKPPEPAHCGTASGKKNERLACGPWRAVWPCWRVLKPVWLSNSILAFHLFKNPLSGVECCRASRGQIPTANDCASEAGGSPHRIMRFVGAGSVCAATYSTLFPSTIELSSATCPPQPALPCLSEECYTLTSWAAYC